MTQKKIDCKITQEIGKRLTTLQTKYLYSEQEAAFKAGIVQQTYHTYLVGANRMSLIAMLGILKLYEITLEDFMKIEVD